MDSKLDHAFFDELCALSVTNQTTTEEERTLAEHLRSCSACREALLQYKDIEVQTLEEATSHGSTSGFLDPNFLGSEEHLRAKRQLLESIRALDRGSQPSDQLTASRGIRHSGYYWASIPFSGWAIGSIAAGLLFLAGVGTARYLLRVDSSALSSRVQANEVSDLKARLNAMSREVDDAKATLAEERSAFGRREKSLVPQNQQLKGRISSMEIARKQEEANEARLVDQTNLLQSSLASLSATNQTLETEKKNLEGQVSRLTADLYSSQAETAAARSHNEELAQAQLFQVRYVERQQKLLATDHDLRDILGARSLRIIDVYDVGSRGELERPFGRVFYTEGKSLIFYAFDLDKQKGLKSGTVFQAWGEKSDGKDARSLGAFYMDDPAKDRWILKVDDTKLLSRIEYVYVTDSPRKATVKPHAKPILSAWLGANPNHP